MKLIDKVKSSKAFKKTIAAIASASIAVSAMAVNVFAAEGDASTTVNYADISSKILNGFGTLMSNCIDLATSIIPLGLGLYGIGILWDNAKKFFTKTAK